MDKMDGAALLSLSIGPTGQVNGQNDMMQNRRRLRASCPKEISCVVFRIIVKYSGKGLSLFEVSRAKSILNRSEQIIHSGMCHSIVRRLRLTSQNALVTAGLMLPTYFHCGIKNNLIT
jgi:hypothetical protein